MRCVCPMGGDRTCPDDCPLAVWASLSATDRKAQRKSVAERLYKLDFTMEQIATQLGTGFGTIQRDLAHLSKMDKCQKKDRGTDTLGRKKSTGRPKNSKSRASPGRGRSGKAQITPAEEEAVARAVLDEGKSLKETAHKAGLKSDMVARFAVAREQGHREAVESLLDAAAAKHFTEKGALRIEEAIRIHRMKLTKSFNQQVEEEVRRRIAAADDLTRKHNKELREENMRLNSYLNERCVFTEHQFSQLLMCVHPDNSASVKVRNEMLQLLVKSKRRLVKSNTQEKAA